MQKRTDAKRTRAPERLRPLLSGGDRRSIAQSNRALTLIRANPRLIGQLAPLAEDKDWLVSMRALDLLEKLAHEDPKSIEPLKHLFIGPLADSTQWEIRLQIVRALPLLPWSVAERKRVLKILLRDVEHPQKFVRAWAVDGLARFAENDSTLLPALHRCLKKLERSGSKALMSRARQIGERLAATKFRATGFATEDLRQRETPPGKENCL